MDNFVPWIASVTDQLLSIFALSAAVACVAWTVTHAEIFKEYREYCERKSKDIALPFFARKLAYVFTCEYCFSHYVAAVALWITQQHFLWVGWRGYVMAFFPVVWLANWQMTLYYRQRVKLREGKQQNDYALYELQERGVPVGVYT